MSTAEPVDVTSAVQGLLPALEALVRALKKLEAPAPTPAKADAVTNARALQLAREGIARQGWRR